MYPLLILREELVCLVILLFLQLNSRFYQMGKDSRSFFRLNLFATGHVIFDIVTVLTVNRLDAVPHWLNWGAHVVFYLFAILFSYEFFCYTAELCLSRAALRRVRLFGIVPPVLYVFLLPLLPIVYLSGKGTNYSLGTAAFVGYGIALLYLLCSIVLICTHSKKLSASVKTALLPMLFIMISAELVQIAVPELLFTGGALTIVMVGFFFSLENPTDVFRRKVQIDALTGVGSRHSYESDIREIERRYAQGKRNTYCIVFCDINGLRAVNNLHGHLEGDNYISSIAQVLQQELQSADKLYRMGGDEFMAIYQDQPEETIRKEICRVHEACEILSAQRNYPVSVAIGYAISGGKYRTIREVLKVADYLMYKDKAEMKKQKVFPAQVAAPTLNIIGLTDRIFDAFALADERSQPFLCNLETGVVRISPRWMEQFDLPGEFFDDFPDIWAERIHPDDREAVQDDLKAVYLGKKTFHEMEYRVLTADGEYVVCSSRGSVLHGKSGEPDLFAGAFVNHGIAERIDPVTGLHNDRALAERVETLISQREAAVIMRISIVSFDRVNMLYSYSQGNELLCQFSSAVQRILPEGGALYRMEGTKFVLCLPGASRTDAEALYQKIQNVARHEIRMPFSLIPLRVAGGAFLLDSDFQGTLPSIRSSLIYAHEQSKNEQRGRLVFYDGGEQDGDLGDYRLLTAVHQDAISWKNGFFLRYQPIARVSTGDIVGAEALLRWQNTFYGEVSPGRFIPWLENDPCFYELGSSILRSALLDAKKCFSRVPSFLLNVNITVQQLQNENFRSMVLTTLKETDYPARQLCLELPERCRELDPDFLEQEIRFFRSHGIRIALDDIGTGSVSFGLLLRLPIDELKLDKRFVQKLPTRQTNQIFVRSIVDSASTLHQRVCFEGVEDPSTYAYLKQYSDSLFQGYLCSRPLRLEEFLDLLDGKSPLQE